MRPEGHKATGPSRAEEPAVARRTRYELRPWVETQKTGIRERDKVCQQCEKTPEENGRALDVHHLNPFRYSFDNSHENLRALCRSCHMRALDRGRRGAAKFADPQQLELRSLSQKELQRIRGVKQRARRRELQEKAIKLSAAGHSLRQIGRAIGVSHQTVSNWLNENETQEQASTG